MQGSNNLQKPMPKLPNVRRLNRKTTLVASAIVVVCVIVIAVLFVLIGSGKTPIHKMYQEVADLGATQGNNMQYAGLSGFAVSTNGYTAITNDNLSYYQTNGQLKWTVKATQDLSFNKVDMSNDGVAALVTTPPTGDAPSGGIFNNDIYGNRIVRYDNNGKLLWQFQLPDNIAVKDISYSGGDTVYVTGSFTGSITLGKDTVTSAGGQDIVLLHVAKNQNAAPAAYFDKQIGTSADDTVAFQEPYTGELVLNLGGSNVLIHAADTSGINGMPWVHKTTLKSSPGTFICNCGNVDNASGDTYVYDWLRAVPNALQVVNSQNVGTVALVDANLNGVVQNSQDQNNNDGGDQPQNPPAALVLQKINSDGLQTDTKQVTEFNGNTDGDYNTIAATDNNLVFAVNNKGSSTIMIYGANLDKQSEYTINNFWPQQLYVNNNHVYLGGYLVPTTGAVTSSDMKIYKVY